MNVMVYAIEALCLGIFMVVATLVTTAFQLPDSPLHQAISDPLIRRLIIGIVIGITAITIIYSPWGKRSGAHLNPAIKLTFWRLKKIRTTDAAIYILAQCLGGICGIWVAGLLIGKTIADPAINYIVTVPGIAGELGAFGAEFLLSLGLMTLVLQVSNRPHLSQLTGLFCGILVAIYITFAAPLSESRAQFSFSVTCGCVAWVLDLLHRTTVRNAISRRDLFTKWGEEGAKVDLQ